MTQEEIYRGIAEKDSRTFTYLYNEYLGFVTRMVTRNSGSEADALDIFQEGLVVLWMNIQKDRFQLQDNTQISTYLYSVCRNLWISKLRKKKKTVAVAEYEAEIPDSSRHPFQQPDPEIMNLRRYFKQLDEKCRKLLKLFYYEKKSLRIIAERMDINENTAKNNKYRCMVKLRALYSQNT